MFSREYLERVGAETGFRPDTLEKVLRLERLLTATRRHPFLGERLVLKGGTALNLFFGGPAPRLSVDLDLNYVHAEDRDEMLREKPEVERALRALAEGDHYRLQSGRDEHAGRKLYLLYRNGLGSDDHIEIDVNFLHRVPLVPAVERDGWTPDPDFPCRAMLAGTEEILAGKILALLDRGAPRDLDEQLTPVLRDGERPNQPALTGSITPLVSSLVTLSAAEQEYVEQIQWGDFHPELVVEDRPELLEQVRRHPGLLWKAENGRRRARR